LGSPVASCPSIPVTLDYAGTDPITINWQTVDTGQPGIATANVDYVQASGTTTFLPGSKQEFIDLTVIGDVTPRPTCSTVSGSSSHSTPLA
jgi:hypothetical protein